MSGYLGDVQLCRRSHPASQPVLVTQLVLSILMFLEVITDIVSDYLCESINGVTAAMNVDFLGTIVPWLSSHLVALSP